ncbi:putative modification methylase HhaI [Eubacterium nodatum ATCC 33099]|nr:putative modification methylase HhaI [Eubacterium nodatum ATCC 33099]
MIEKYTIGSMFAGIGGICLAFKQSGCKIVWANEIDKYACKTYRLNFGDEYIVQGDIQDIDTKDIPKFDILTAGFPCQTFSSAGLLQGFNDPRGNLFFETARVIHDIKPKVVFLENVANLVKHDDGKTFEVICKTLKDLNYHVTFQVMNAKEYGNLPQQRNRIYIVAFRNKEYLKKFKFPDRLILTRTAFDLFDKEKQAEKYYMDGHRMWDHMMEYMDDRNRIYRFTDWGLSHGMEGICPTLLAAMGSRFERIPFFYDDYSVRLITPREAARLQGFPEDYILPQGHEKQVYKQIGNSVAVPVVSRIAENIIKAFPQKIVKNKEERSDESETI